MQSNLFSILLQVFSLVFECYLTLQSLSVRFSQYRHFASSTGFLFGYVLCSGGTSDNFTTFGDISSTFVLFCG